MAHNDTVGLGDVFNLGIKGISGLIDYQRSKDTGKQLGQLAPQLQQMASPYPGADRAFAAKQLRGFMGGSLGPSDLPNYNQLVKTQERIFARAGKAFSGNAATDLASTLSNEQRRYMEFLSQVAGTQFNPATGADLFGQVKAEQFKNQQNRGAELADFGTDAASLLTKIPGLSNLFNGGGGSFLSSIFGGGGGGAGGAAGTGTALSSGASAAAFGGGPMVGLGGAFGSPAAATAFGGGPMLGAGAGGLSALGPAAYGALGIGGIFAAKQLISALTSPGGQFNPLTGAGAEIGDAVPFLQPDGSYGTQNQVAGFGQGRGFSLNNLGMFNDRGDGAFQLNRGSVQSNPNSSVVYGPNPGGFFVNPNEAPGAPGLNEESANFLGLGTTGNTTQQIGDALNTFLDTRGEQGGEGGTLRENFMMSLLDTDSASA